MAHLLGHYLSSAASRGFVWGEHDCVLFAAGWAHEVCGTDPARSRRGVYCDAASAKAYLAACGGIHAAIHEALSACDWREVRTDGVSSGDIVLVGGVDHDSSEAAGIAVDRGRVALLTRRGLVVAPHPILKAWRYHG